MKSAGVGKEQKKKREIEAPVCLGDLFAENDEEKEEETFSQLYEVQELDIGGNVFKIRQFAWHGANANKVWPGTFNLAEYICDNRDQYVFAPILELGAATGALSVYLSSPPFSLNICTSDIDDGGEVEENICHNFQLNNLTPALHIPHTWGTGWRKSTSEAVTKSNEKNRTTGDVNLSFKYVVASDILLYVSAYPALVQTLCEIFQIDNKKNSDENVEGLDEGVVMADCYYEDEGKEGDNDNYDNIECDGEYDSYLVADLVAVGMIEGLIEGGDEPESEVFHPSTAIACPSIAVATTSPSKHTPTSTVEKKERKEIDQKVAVVAVAVAVEMDEDVVISQSEKDHELILESDPEPAILEAETVRSSPRPSKDLKKDLKNAGSPIKSNDDNELDGKGEGGLISGMEKCAVKSSSETGNEAENGEKGEKGAEKTQQKTDGIDGVDGVNPEPPIEFLMSWNRRIAESSIFFNLMTEAGFTCDHKGKCVYSFKVKSSENSEI